MAIPIVTGNVMQYDPEYIDDWGRQVTGFCKGATNIVTQDGLFVTRVGFLYFCIGNVTFENGVANVLPSPALKDTFIMTINGDAALIAKGSTELTYSNFTGEIEINGQYYGE